MHPLLRRQNNRFLACNHALNDHGLLFPLSQFLLLYGKVSSKKYHYASSAVKVFY